MAETGQSHQATPFTEHAPDRTGNNLKKWPDIRRLDKPTRHNAKLETVWQRLKSGRPRAVGLEVPVDVWSKQIESNPTKNTGSRTSSEAIDNTELDRMIDIIRASSSPMIAVGGGAQGYSEHVCALAEKISAPVMAFRTGHGVLSSEHALGIDMPTAHRLWPDCDLIIGLGSRLQTQRMGWGMDDRLKVIHIDMDEDELSRISSPDAGICGDLEQVLPKLLSALGQQPDRQKWADHVADIKTSTRAELLETLAPQAAWIQAIRTAFPRDGIFVDELAQVGYVSRILFPT
ncbi:MAG: hypothetical protein AAF468_22210 [Pseudomonadota bacterium]